VDIRRAFEAVGVEFFTDGIRLTSSQGHAAQPAQASPTDPSEEKRARTNSLVHCETSCTNSLRRSIKRGTLWILIKIQTSSS
jgi:hypothetical protein